MKNVSDTRGRIIHLLEEALALAEEINDGNTGYAIERALDLARAQAFKPFAAGMSRAKRLAGSLS
jgi:hypothetical protein